MTAFEDNSLTRSWAALGARLGKPRAVLCISAHWETRGVMITGADRPRTIHDFTGFPRPLYEFQYPAPGDPGFAKLLQKRLADFGARIDVDGWGLDHGCWALMKFLFPRADVPVLQLSMDLRRTPQQHYEIGQTLAKLRDEDVLLVGSGNIVHNLRLYNPADSGPAPWARAFDDAVVERMRHNDDGALLNYPALGPEAALAVPTPDHFLPLLYILGARRDGETPRVFNRDIHSSLSMTSVVLGDIKVPGLLDA